MIEATTAITKEIDGLLDCVNDQQARVKKMVAKNRVSINTTYYL